MATWFTEGAKMGCVAGLALAVLYGMKWMIDCYRSYPDSRRDWDGGFTFALLMTSLLAATVATTAIAGGCSNSAVHALTRSMHPGSERVVAGMLLGSVVWAVVEGLLGACIVLLFGMKFTPNDGQISLGAIMIGCMGAVFGAFLGALVGYLTTAR